MEKVDKVPESWREAENVIESWRKLEVPRVPSPVASRVRCPGPRALGGRGVIGARERRAKLASGGTSSGSTSGASGATGAT